MCEHPDLWNTEQETVRLSVLVMVALLHKNAASSRGLILGPRFFLQNPIFQKWSRCDSKLLTSAVKKLGGVL